jgi:hypothetical protein
MLHQKKLDMKFWAEAVSTAVYVKNRTPTSITGDKTPEEVWSGEKPSVKHLRVFGSDAYFHVPRELRSKLDPKSKRCIFVGYSLTSKGYRVWDPIDNKIRVSRDLVVLEQFVTQARDNDAASTSKENPSLVPLEVILESPMDEGDHLARSHESPSPPSESLGPQGYVPS